MTSSAPKTVRQAAYWVRTRIEPRRDLLPSDRLVARVIAFARSGPREHAVTRARIAARTGLSIRTVTRSIARLTAARVLEVIEVGRIKGHKRYQQVYALLSPQVAPGDTLSPLSAGLPTGTFTSGRRRARRTLADRLGSPARPRPTRPDLLIPLF